MSSLAVNSTSVTRPLDRVAFARPISATDPAGPSLRDDGLYDAIREAARTQFGDEAFGIPEKRPDWLVAEQLCRDALEAETKDLYVLVGYAEASAQTRGPAGFEDAAWGLAHLHAELWASFHPRPSTDGSCEARARLLELLVRRLSPILVEWNKPAHQPRQGLGALDVDQLARARASLQVVAATVPDRYGAHAVSLAPLIAALEQLEATGSATPAVDADSPAARDHAPASPAPTAAPAGGSLAILASRVPMWDELVARFRAEGPPRLPAPEAARRRRFEELFAAERWRELIAEVDATLAGRASALMWLDLHRFTAGALGQLGHAYADARRWLIVGLRAVLQWCPGIENATFADGSPVADPATHRWLSAEVCTAPTKPAAPASTADATSTATAPNGDEPARARHLAQQARAEGLLGAGKPLAAAGLLRRLADEARRRDLATWEGPAFAAATLSLLCRAYDQLAKRGIALSGLQARRFDAHEELLGLDPDHSQNLPE